VTNHPRDNNHYALTKEVFRHSAIHQQGYYDSQPGKKLKHSFWQLWVRRIVVRTLDELLAGDPGVTRILDVGCGRGDLTIALANRYPHLTGLRGSDFCHEALEIAIADAQSHKNVFFQEANVLEMPFKEGSFDVTLCINVLHHIYDSDLEIALRELARITKKYLILEIKNKNNPYYKSITSRSVHPGARLAVFTSSPDQIGAMLSSCRFQIMQAKGLVPVMWLSPLLVQVYKRSS